MHIYCLFCQTQKTTQIREIIEAVLPVRCISPKITQRCWKKGVEEHRIHDYLPGYLFLYAREPLTSFRDVTRFTGVIRMLGREEDDYELVGPDRTFARMLADMDGTIGIMKAVQVGDQVRLASDIYHGFTGEIIRLDRRKGRAQIRFDFDGNIQKVWVGYDLIDQPEKAEPSEG